jgi:hypothetical protein
MRASEPNPDPLERRLPGQPFRELPTEWRDGILAAARAAAPRRSALGAWRAPAWWRAVFWPNPVAWAGVAAVWVAILVLNQAGRWEPAGSVAVTRDSSPGLALALIEHRRQLNELLETPAAEPVPLSRPTPSGPRGALSRTNRVA